MLALPDGLPEERGVLIPPAEFQVRQVPNSAAMKARSWAPFHEPVVFERKGAAIARGLVIRDSFSTWGVESLLSSHFARVTYVWWRMPRDIVLDERPQIVIEEMVERWLSNSGEPPVTELPSPTH